MPSSFTAASAASAASAPTSAVTSPAPGIPFAITSTCREPGTACTCSATRVIVDISPYTRSCNTFARPYEQTRVTPSCRTDEDRPPHASEDRRRVEWGSGPADDPQRRGGEQELPTAFALADGGEILELEIVEEMDAHCLERQHVDRKRDPFCAARSRVAVGVRAQRGDAALGKELGGGRVQSRLRVRRVPALVRQTPRVTSADKQDVASRDRHALVAL